MEYVQQIIELEDWEMEDRREQFLEEMDTTRWLVEDPLAMLEIAAILRVEGIRLEERTIA